MAIAKNLKQIYDTNPSTTAAANDLIYLDKSPYGLTNDSGIKCSDLSAQISGILPFRYTVGMNLSVSDVTQIYITAGACKDDTNTYDIKLPSGGLIDSTVGGLGGIDTGSVAPNTLYFFYVIEDDAQLLPAGGIMSLSSTVPTYPAGYSVCAKRGFCFTDSSSNFIDGNLIDLRSFLTVYNPVASGTLTIPGITAGLVNVHTLGVDTLVTLAGGGTINGINIGTVTPAGGSFTTLAASSTIAGSISGNAATVTTNANLTGGVTSVGNVATVVTNANLTGGVTSVGNAATVVTNANLTGPITSVGNATTVNSTLVPLLATNNVFTNTNTFLQIGNPIVQYTTPGSALTENSGTLTASQLCGGITYFTPTANATWTFPLASAIDSFLNAPVVGLPTPVVGVKSIRFINSTNFIITFVANTNMNFNGLSTPGTLILNPNGALEFDLVKLDSTPTYTTFGRSQSVSLTVGTTSITTSQTITYASFGGRAIANSASAITITLPQQSTLATAVGTNFQIENIGVGDVTLVKEGSETLAGNTLIATGGTAQIFRDTTTNWQVSGGTSVLIGSVAFNVDVVGNSAYSLAKMPIAGTLNNLYSICRSGTCTATFSINATTITATPNSVSSTNQTQATTALNTFVAGDYINATVTSNTVCLGMNLNFDFYYRVNI